jgi:hypothetical protein
VQAIQREETGQQSRPGCSGTVARPRLERCEQRRRRLRQTSGAEAGDSVEPSGRPVIGRLAWNVLRHRAGTIDPEVRGGKPAIVVRAGAARMRAAPAALQKPLDVRVAMGRLQVEERRLPQGPRRPLLR